MVKPTEICHGFADVCACTVPRASKHTINNSLYVFI
jgi:hypothetical protein